MTDARSDARAPAPRRRLPLLLALAAVFAVAVGGTVLAWDALRIELRLESAPTGARVEIDGEVLGTTPLAVTLAPGRHRVELTRDAWMPATLMLELDRGQRVERTVSLRRGTGRLSLLSNPRGAWVEIDGERLDDVTPLTVEVASGPARVRMGLAERRDAEDEVVVPVDGTLEVNLDLAMDPHGTLVVSVVPADARVRFPDLETAPEGDPRRGVRLPIGEHLVEVSRPGHETRRIRTDVRRGDNRATVTLTRALGALTVSTPGAEARITVTHETTPGRTTTVDYRPGMRLPVGRIEIRAQAIGRRTAYRTLDLDSDGARVTLTLDTIDAEPGSRIDDTLASGGRAPTMIVVPGGRFVMGDPAGPPSVRPATERVLTQPFAVSVHEITGAEYLEFVRATGARVDARVTDDETPVRHVEWEAAVAYADWLTAETGARYRLPTEAEWEYAARAGTDPSSWLGDAPDALCAHANLADQSTHAIYRDWLVADCDDGWAKVAPVGRFAPNPFGLRDMLGNVAEWVLECGMPDYAYAPEDGTIIATGPRCTSHGVRGGSWDDPPDALRVDRRSFASGAGDDRGIRLVREL